MSNKEKATILSDKDQKLQDGLENLVAQLGTEQDKRSHSRFVNNKQLSLAGNREELNALYRTDWVAGKIVDIIPEDMTREWRSFTGDIDPALIAKLVEEEDRVKLRSSFMQAHKWARLYGTAYVVLYVEDGQSPEEPLDINKIKKGGLRHVKPVDRHRIQNSEVTPVSDPMDANYGFPEFYRFVDTSVRIHHTRILRFDGITIPYDEFRKNDYNSDSVLDRLYDALTNISTVTNGAASMVYEANVDIIKVKGLMNHLASADGESLLRKRFGLAKVMKSFNNMLLLDNEEEFASKTNAFAGIPDLLDKYALFLSAASDIPATRLLGSSASGLNATGEGDLKNYYDTVRSDQITTYKPLLDYFDKIMAKSLGISDENIEYEFNSLFQITPKEKADMEFTNAQRDALYIDRDVVSVATVAKDLKQSATYVNITDEDIEELEEEADDFNTDPTEEVSSTEQENEAGEETEIEAT